MSRREIPSNNPNLDSIEVQELRKQLNKLIKSLGKNRDNFKSEPVHGRIYPADSIDYTEQSGLTQTGSSPSYWGGLWSLTCCKHDMRQEHFFDYFEEREAGVLRPTEPLFIFTCAGKMGSDRPKWADTKRRWLSSVALVTHAFRGMDDYGEFLLDRREEIWRPRISTQSGEKSNKWAIEHGDCHAIIGDNEVEEVGSPFPDHDHVSTSGTSSCGCSETIDPDHDHTYHDDNDPSSLKFVSTPGYWISWSEPEFYWTVGNSPDIYGGGQDKLAYSRGKNLETTTVLSQLKGVV
ncbi:hypothetical protein [Natranaeroarchaeum sulfidigenes]|uniref:Uncharacterized protein n=1 Tax=Natranaeroarchaeum sulfidigenes TaxID=2784880 RepID=A0A897MXA6_9EURY|nr:hypothetical protein [Natranaeroarchaeum sulfidigenes]QSG02796.1 hypothetical protein AArcS_1585 [Natranaeroarchaeum sulfidigenes]